MFEYHNLNLATASLIWVNVRSEATNPLVLGSS